MKARQIVINVSRRLLPIGIIFFGLLPLVNAQSSNHLLIASKSYTPLRNSPAEETLAIPINFAIPEEIPVNKGNAGNGELILQFRTVAGELVTCTYKGGANSSNPKTQDQILKGKKFFLQHIDSPFAAWDIVATTYFKLNIVTGAPQSGATEVRLNLPVYGNMKPLVNKAQIDARKNAFKRNALLANTQSTSVSTLSVTTVQRSSFAAASVASAPVRPEVFCSTPATVCASVITVDKAYFENHDLSAINSDLSCLSSGSLNGGWYTFTAKSSGNLNFTLTPETPGLDYDWAVFNVTGKSCADIATNGSLLVECNNGSPEGIASQTGPNGAAGPQSTAPIPLVNGNTYMIFLSCYYLGLPLVDDAEDDVASKGFSIDFSASTAIIISPLAVPAASSNSPICNGSTLNLSASTVEGATYRWQGPNGFTSLLQNPVITNVSSINAGIYQVKAIAGGCESALVSTNVSVNNATPIASQATFIGNTGFTAVWSLIPGSLGYVVELDDNPDFLSLVGTYNIGSEDIININIQDLTPNALYYYRVKTNCNKNVSSNVIPVATTNSKIYWAISNGNWGNKNTWSHTENGQPTSDIPSIGSTVFINGFVIEVTENRAATAVYVYVDDNNKSDLNIKSGVLDVSGDFLVRNRRIE